MNPERYAHIKQVFHAALDHPAGERSAFLAEACNGDPELRATIEALIAADERPGAFMDAPAYQLAADLLVEQPSGSLAGQQISHYQIISLLGSGGMGDVYLAKDIRLGRQVALKLLPDYLTDDESRVRRFKQEARAASALNHPNIVTIYEIEQADGRHFIATEYVEGETLRERVKRGPLELAMALDIALQVAGALARAHQVGIVHRDIKPENIMLTSEDRVKILDFGLAKYSPPIKADAAAADVFSTLTGNHTEPGVLMGTTAYMSPEQVRGFAVDARTDIWSLGVVLYEMLADRTPFSGPTSSDVLAAILEREPARLPDETFAPASLQRIISRTLEKDRERRYQTTKDLLLDLESLRREIAAGSSAGRVVALKEGTPQPSAFTTVWSRNKSSIVLVLVTALVLAAATVIGRRALRRSSSEPPRPIAAAVVPKPERSLSYWLLVQKYRDGKPFQEPFRLGREINFEQDYRVRLNLGSSQSGHLYVLNEGPAESGGSSAFVILFPSPTANKGMSLVAGSQIQIPEQSWFQFDAQEGVEKIWLVWSAEIVPELEALQRFANARDRGLINDPGLNSAVRSFLQAHQSPASVAERNEEKNEVIVKGSGDILTHLLRLEHH